MGGRESMAKAKRTVVVNKETGEKQRYKSSSQASKALGYNWQWAKAVIANYNGHTKQYHIYYEE